MAREDILLFNYLLEESDAKRIKYHFTIQRQM